MWRAVLTEGEVFFERDGKLVARMVWTGSPDDREALLDELIDTIGFYRGSVLLTQLR